MRGLSDNTIRVRLDLLCRLRTHADAPLRELEPHHLLAFERIAIAGRAAETRRAYCSHLRAFYAWAKRTGIVEHDPSELLTMPKVPRHLPRPIEEDDLRLALSSARPKMAAILTLAGYAGLRACEIAGLDWSDVVRTDKGAWLTVRHGKGAKQRQVEIGETVIRALQHHGIRRRGPVFIGRDGSRMDARSVSSSANRFLRLQGVDATLHQLRHRFGTIAYELSSDLRLVQDMLGHASPTTTAGYVRTSGAAAARMIAALDALGTGPAPSVSSA